MRFKWYPLTPCDSSTVRMNGIEVSLYLVTHLSGWILGHTCDMIQFDSAGAKDQCHSIPEDIPHYGTVLMRESIHIARFSLYPV